jgi:hypothetical protein
MVPKLPLAAVALLLACASSSSTWNWHPKEGSFDEQKYRQDVDLCEERTRISDSRSPAVSHRSARPYGGWGNHVFDSCMDGRGWALKRGEVPPGDVAPAAAPPAGAPPAPTTGDGTTQL